MTKLNAQVVAGEPSEMRRGAVGMLWVTLALLFSKGLSFFSQIVMGYVLPVEAYAVFGLAGTAVALIAGFQNSGVAKALIQKHEQCDKLFPTYSAFSFLFGIFGALILAVVAVVFDQLYGMPDLKWVLWLTCLSVPFIAINTTLIASLSVQYRFKDINVTDMRRSLIYYGVLIAAAVMGAGAYSMALAAVVGALAAHILLLRVVDASSRYFAVTLECFIELVMALRWVLLSGFLVALAMRADFIVVGKVLSTEEFGYYAFGFMLVTSLTLPISTGINQVLMPILSRLQKRLHELKHQLQRFSSAIVLLGSMLCILILGVGSALVHDVWGGKWDDAQLIINALVVAMPFRFLATISGVGFEATGQWRWRNSILALEALMLFVFAYVGAYFYGVEGAIVAVISQRVMSGLLGYMLLIGSISQDVIKTLIFYLRLYLPFLISVLLLFYFSPTRHGYGGGISVLASCAIETMVSLAAFLVAVFIFNRNDALLALRIIKSRFGRG